MTSRTVQGHHGSPRTTMDCHGRATEALQISPRIAKLYVRDGPGGSGSLVRPGFKGNAFWAGLFG